MLSVKFNKKFEFPIQNDVFRRLFDISHIKDYKTFNLALENKCIDFRKLKDLAYKAGIPYPLFFAPASVVDKQISDKTKHIYEKISPKEVVKLIARGKLDLRDIELIVTDLSRKQEFLKKRVLRVETDNELLGLVAGDLKRNISIEEIALKIRTKTSLNLTYLRTLSKSVVLSHIIRCLEEKNVFVSLSSFNYMPQNIDPSLALSGFCMKDRKVPFIFINTRDGEERQKIIESEGRQIFTLLSLTACLCMNRFDPNSIKIAFGIASEVIIPSNEVSGITIETLNELKEMADYFKVTPSMLLYRLEKTTDIDKNLANNFRAQLHQELKQANSKVKRHPSPVNGYSKYNGAKFSKEVVKAFLQQRISKVEVINILFRSGKFNNKTFDAYINSHI